MSGTYTGADLFVDALREYGVTHLFGNPGTTELAVVDAVAARDEPEYVLALHEDIAVGMAAGYASTRRYHARRDPSVTPVGVVNLHVAPGVAHGIGNLYGADWGGAPLVVTAGDYGTDFQYEDPILSGDEVELTRQFTKWSDRVLDVEALPTMLRRAFRVALTPPTGPVFLELPTDVMMAETDADPERLGPIPDAGRGDPRQLELAAEILSGADRPVLVLGDAVARSGVDAVGAAVDLAGAVGARVHGEVLSSEVNFPEDHDQWAGRLPGGAMETLREADAVAFVGCSTSYSGVGRYPVVPGTDYVHVSDDAWQVGKNQPADAAVVADPGRAMADLAERVAGRVTDAERRDRLEHARRTVREIEGRTEDDADPDDPRPSKSELARALADVATGAYVVDEAMTSSDALLREWPMVAEGYLGNKGAGLGYGLPASVGAAIAERERPDPRAVVGYVGDGSSFYYPQSLYSAVRAGVDLAVVVPDNRGYYILKRNTVDLLGGAADDYDFSDLQFDPPVDIPAFAEAQGATGHLAETADEAARALERALEAGGVHLIDAPIHD